MILRREAAKCQARGADEMPFSGGRVYPFFVILIDGPFAAFAKLAGA